MFFKPKYKVVPVTKVEYNPLFMQYTAYAIKKRIIPFWWRFLVHDKIVVRDNGRASTSKEVLTFNDKKKANEELASIDITGKEISTVVWANNKQKNVCRK